MSNIAQKVYKYESLNKINKSKNKKNSNVPVNKPSKPKPLPEWNANINDVEKYKLSSAELVNIFFLYLRNFIYFI